MYSLNSIIEIHTGVAYPSKTRTHSIITFHVLLAIMARVVGGYDDREDLVGREFALD